jgi:putative tricarboxylic transport membrane protein
VVSSFVTIMICAAAAEDVRWRETILVAIALTLFCSLLFPYGLNLPMPLWPWFWR